MQVPRSRLAAVAVKGRVYAVGGIRDGRDDTNVAQSGAVEEYDPNKDRWVMKAEMPTPRHGHAAVVLRDNVLTMWCRLGNCCYTLLKPCWTNFVHVRTDRLLRHD